MTQLSLFSVAPRAVAPPRLGACAVCGDPVEAKTAICRWCQCDLSDSDVDATGLDAECARVRALCEERDANTKRLDRVLDDAWEGE